MLLEVLYFRAQCQFLKIVGFLEGDEGEFLREVKRDLMSSLTLIQDIMVEFLSEETRGVSIFS